MKILAIDTSTKFLSLAIAEEDKILAGFHWDLEQQHCAKLIPEIDRLLKKVKLRFGDIDCIAFSKGPGSFTGLRIGAATVKGLALVTKIKIIGVPTLDVLACNIQRRSYCQSENCPQKIEPSLIIPIVDAKRGNVYASIYSYNGKKLKRHMKYSVLPIYELLKEIKGNAIFLGDGLIPYGKIIKDEFKFKAEFAEEKDWYPNAVNAAKLAYELIKKRRFEDPDKFTPLYLYPKDIQCRKKLK